MVRFAPFILSLFLLTTSCITRAEPVPLSTTSLNAIQASGQFNITMTKGTPAMDITWPKDFDRNKVTIEQNDSELTLKENCGSFWNFESCPKDPIIVTIKTSALKNITLHGDSQIAFSGFSNIPHLTLEAFGNSQIKGSASSTNRLSIQAAGNSLINLAQTSAQNLALVASGSSDITVSLKSNADKARLDVFGSSRVIGLGGSLNYLTVKTAGNSFIDFSKVVTQNVILVCTGSNDIALNTAKNGSISGRISGTAHIHYKGKPNAVRVTTSGNATISVDS